MKISLIPGTVGININASELLDLAIKYNFESIYPLINDLNKMNNEEAAKTTSDSIKNSFVNAGVF